MIRNDEQCLSIIDAFQSAAVGAQSWETAMQSFADITGSRSGQLTAFGSGGSVLYRHSPGPDQGDHGQGRRQPSGRTRSADQSPMILARHQGRPTTILSTTLEMVSPPSDR